VRSRERVRLNRNTLLRRLLVREDRSQCTGQGVDAGTEEASGFFMRKKMKIILKSGGTECEDLNRDERCGQREGRGYIKPSVKKCDG